MGEIRRVTPPSGSWTITEFRRASGASGDVNVIDIGRVENGMLVESWVRMDLLGFMERVTVIPS